MQIQTYTQNGCRAQTNTHKMQTFNHSNLKKKTNSKKHQTKSKTKNRYKIWTTIKTKTNRQYYNIARSNKQEHKNPYNQANARADTPPAAQSSPNDDHSKFENRFKKKTSTNQNLIPRGMFGVSLNLSEVVDYFDTHRMAVNGLNWSYCP